MRDYVNEHLRNHAGMAPMRPRVELADGTSISVQASSGHYCEPRADGLRHYTAVEVGFPADIEFFAEWAEREWELGDPCPTCGEVPEAKATGYSGVAGWVPVEVVNEYIESRGGPREEET